MLVLFLFVVFFSMLLLVAALPLVVSCSVTVPATVPFLMSNARRVALCLDASSLDWGDS